jgi:hypothetical protein
VDPRLVISEADPGGERSGGNAMAKPLRSTAVPPPARITMLVVSLLCALVCAGCSPTGAADPADTPTSDQVAPVNKTSPAPRTGPARLLPDLSGAAFGVQEVDLAAGRVPMRTAVTLIRQAAGDVQAPRVEVRGVDASTDQAQAAETADLAASALACLHQKGARALHSYVDTRHRYSMSIALVVNAKSYRQDVAWCAISSVIPYVAGRTAGGDSVPTIAPCVGERRSGAALVTWVATTDTMCAALGDPVAPVQRPLRRGDSGTDVARLQLALNDVGSQLRVDGRMGTSTVQAVRAFQNCYAVGARRPGVADPVTVNALTSAASSGWSKDLCSP